MKTITTFLIIAGLSAAGVRAATTDTLLDVDLLPNTSYDVKATVNTSLLSSLAALLSGGPSPIQVVDDLGNVLAELSVDDLIAALTNANGEPAIVDLDVNLGDTVGSASQLLLRVVDTPLLQVLGVTAAPEPANRPPGVGNLRKRMVGAKKQTLDVRGKAVDADGSVRKVEVFYRGRGRRVEGTSNWKSTVRLTTAKTHRVTIRAIDNEGLAGPKKQLLVRTRK